MTRDCNNCVFHQQGKHPNGVYIPDDAANKAGFSIGATCGDCLAYSAEHLPCFTPKKCSRDLYVHTVPRDSLYATPPAEMSDGEKYVAGLPRGPGYDYTLPISVGTPLTLAPSGVEKVSPPMILSTDPAQRKRTPITTGVLDYFPRAVAAVAECSLAGNEQHHPGTPLHWDYKKSNDHADCISRHLIDRHTYDTDGVRHIVKLAWRALALLETTLREEEGA